MEKLPAKRGSRVAAAVTAVMLGVAISGCGTEPDPDRNNPPAFDPAEDETGNVTLEVLAPTVGETVSVPFELVVDADVDLGPIDNEDHHLHVWFDAEQDDYEIYESNTNQIEQAPEGETTMWVQVHTFDHQPASEPIAVTLTVEGGGAADDSDDSADQDEDDSGGGNGDGY